MSLTHPPGTLREEYPGRYGERGSRRLCGDGAVRNSTVSRPGRLRCCLSGIRSPAECHRSFKDAAPPRRRRSLSLQTRIPRPRRNQSSQPGRPLRPWSPTDRIRSSPWNWSPAWTSSPMSGRNLSAKTWKPGPSPRPCRCPKSYSPPDRTPLLGSSRACHVRRTRRASAQRPPSWRKVSANFTARHPAPRYQAFQCACNTRRPGRHPRFRTDRRNERRGIGAV